MRRVILVLTVLILIAAAVAAWQIYGRLVEPFKLYSAEEQFVEIAPGSSTRAIGRALVEAGVVRDTLVFRIALWQSGAARRLKAGEYRFDRPMTAADVVDKLARGDVYLHAITFPEGLTIREMARIFEAQGFGSAEEFLSAAGEVGLIADLDPDARDLEGYLFPETYALPRRGTARELVSMMTSRFQQVFSHPLREEAAAQGLSVRQVTTLASIVEKETAKTDERPLVAAVYLRRLRIGMALQSDPTVIYALTRAGRYDGNLTRENLQFDSPYNTYRHAGLPPGPIAAPGRSSIEAVVRPAESDYLYFVSRNDGTHVFARTLEEHNRNVSHYQVDALRAQKTRAR
jgi:peptidoglycan lytic transglycosylase G